MSSMAGGVYVSGWFADKFNPRFFLSLGLFFTSCVYFGLFWMAIYNVNIVNIYYAIFIVDGIV